MFFRMKTSLLELFSDVTHHTNSCVLVHNQLFMNVKIARLSSFFRLFSSRLLHFSVNSSLFHWDEMDNTHQLFTGFYLTGVRIRRESPQRSFTEKKSIVDGEPTKNTSNRKHLSKSSLIHVQLLFTFFHSSPLFTLRNCIYTYCELLSSYTTASILLFLSLSPPRLALSSLLQYRLLLSIRWIFLIMF